MGNQNEVENEENLRKIQENENRLRKILFCQPRGERSAMVVNIHTILTLIQIKIGHTQEEQWQMFILISSNILGKFLHKLQAKKMVFKYSGNSLTRGWELGIGI